MMHFRILGFWRVAAAILVMMYHFLFYGPESANWMAGRMVALMPLLDMFMMISGFLIMFRYVDRLLMEPGSYAHFIWRRVARFYPLYFVTLAYFVMVGIAVHLGFIGSTAANTSAAAGRNAPEPEMPTTPSMTRSVVGGMLSTMRPPARRNAARPLRWVRSGLSRIASAAAPRRRRKVAAHSASPPLSPEPTTAHTRRPATPPVRAANSPMTSVASP